MRWALILGAAVTALVASATALAGGWATVELSSSPKGLSAGEPWIVEITVLQHGLATQPLSGLKPALTIRKVASARTTSSSIAPQASRTFEAKATGRPGVYRARVVFPRAGVWRYEVYDAFTAYGGARTHRFKAVRIGPGAP
jgi:hypothetical protein